MVDEVKRHIPWSDTPFPLGRSIWHDPKSLDFPAETARALKTTYHPRRIPILDQLKLGSCTGNAETGLLGTEPFYTAIKDKLGAKTPTYDEAMAVSIYSEATHYDPWPGEFPPDDTGSTGLAVMKVARKRGWITSYRHAFGLDHALHALVLRPVIIGIPWYNDMFNPGPGGLISVGGGVAGGHEVVLDSIDVENRLVGGANSWNSTWGANGRFKLTWDTFDALLKDEGDVTTAVILR
jgi:hypothetical protein